MPTVDYVFISPSEINHEICVISDAEWERREEESHRWESDGRVARREISVFDAMMAEIHADKESRRDKFLQTHDRNNKPKNKRKSNAYIKRNGKDWRKDEHYAGDKFLHYPECLMMPGIRADKRYASLRKDFMAELRQHEDAIADYLYVMEKSRGMEMIAERDLDISIHQEAPVTIVDWYKADKKEAEALRDEALTILRGEIY